MKQLLIYLFFLVISLSACDSDTNNKPENETDEVVQKTDTIKQVVEVPSAPVTVGFPYLGSESLEGYELKREHEYGGGDCMAQVFEYVSGDNVMTIDSMVCGDYGFTTTRYLVEKEALKMVYIAEVQNTINSWTETIYDFRKEPFCKYERTGEQTEDRSMVPVYVNQPSKDNLVDEVPTSEELMKEYLDLFNRIVEGD